MPGHRVCLHEAFKTRSRLDQLTPGLKIPDTSDLSVYVPSHITPASTERFRNFGSCGGFRAIGDCWELQPQVLLHPKDSFRLSFAFCQFISFVERRNCSHCVFM